jgi:hypothetical protein
MANKNSKDYKDGFQSGTQSDFTGKYAPLEKENIGKAKQGIASSEPGIADYWQGWLDGVASVHPEALRQMTDETTGSVAVKRAIYQNDKFNLTTQEQEAALKAAGIPTDPSTWTPEQMAEAEKVLQAAVDAKIGKSQRANERAGAKLPDTDYEKLVAEYGQSLADKAKEWFESNKTADFAQTVKPFEFLVTNEYLWKSQRAKPLTAQRSGGKWRD